MTKKQSRMKLLNQYTSRTVPGFVNVLGTATNTATVSLWSQDNLALYPPPTRQGDYFRGEMLFNNNTGALWLTITNVAVLSNYTGADIVTNTIGKLFVPKTAEVFGYDADGNLTNDGRWSYTWDAENRIASFTRNSSAPTGSRVKLDCAYDSQSRRTQKIVSSWNGSTYVAQSTNKIVYDGWNLIAILDPNSSLLASFQWGMDASGTMQGAGGVGGLISMTVHQGTNAGTYLYCYDGNHNVTTLVNAANGAIEAIYDYDPFLGILRATGRLAFINPFVGSTKFCDWETGFLYYGYRYYDPDTGRWPNRDPIGERGGVNVYAFARNDPVGEIDFLGLLAATVHSIEYRGHGSAEKNGTTWQYVEVDSAIQGQVPLNVTDAKPAASVTATLDDGFNARIVAWTALSRDRGITALQMSTDLSGTIKVCCPCPFKKVRANWSARAGLSGTAGNASAQFDNERPAITSWNRPSASRSGVKDKTLDSSYCATYAFVIGQGWTDVSKTTPTTSTVRVQATFECIN